MGRRKTKICSKCKTPLPISDFHKKKQSSDGFCTQCKKCSHAYNYMYRKQYPWKTTLNLIKQRCNNPKDKRYYCYGERGIKCNITIDEVRKLWLRDNASSMKTPSIDREDNNGDYVYDNCRYIEKGENSAKDKIKPVLQFDLNNNFIRKWRSQIEVSRKLKITKSNISQCCTGKRKTAGGFIWKFKKDHK